MEHTGVGVVEPSGSAVPGIRVRHALKLGLENIDLAAVLIAQVGKIRPLGAGGTRGGLVEHRSAAVEHGDDPPGVYRLGAPAMSRVRMGMGMRRPFASDVVRQIADVVLAVLGTIPERDVSRSDGDVDTTAGGEQSERGQKSKKRQSWPSSRRE